MHSTRTRHAPHRTTRHGTAQTAAQDNTTHHSTQVMQHAHTQDGGRAHARTHHARTLHAPHMHATAPLPAGQCTRAREAEENALRACAPGQGERSARAHAVCSSSRSPSLDARATASTSRRTPAGHAQGPQMHTRGRQTFSERAARGSEAGESALRGRILLLCCAGARANTQAGERLVYRGVPSVVDIHLPRICARPQRAHAWARARIGRASRALRALGTRAASAPAGTAAS